MQHNRRCPWLVSVVCFAALGACSSNSVSSGTPKLSTAPPSGDSSTSSSVAVTTTEPSELGSTFDSDIVHTFAIEYAAADFDDMVAKLNSSGSNEWIEATVTIDGSVFQHAGIRLKGTLEAGDTATLATPEALPWYVRLDKYVDNQALDGYADFVVRTSNSQTALNEALALQLLGRAGLKTQRAMSVKFSVNGGAQSLRLVIEGLNKAWETTNFDRSALLYKAEKGGDYSYRGTDPAAYANAFKQEAGKKSMLALIGFLDFVNNSTDADFAANIAARIDLQALATYLALEDLMQNYDDLDGPGNNSYLSYDVTTKRFTVVAWDHNFAFRGADKVMNKLFSADNIPPGFDPNQMTPQTFDAAIKAVSEKNPLVTRVKKLPEFTKMYDSARAELLAKLFTSGIAEKDLRTWAAVLTDGASDLVDAATVTKDVDKILATFPS